MKSTGIIRKIDDLGRIVIPKEIRKTLNIKQNETLEIYIEEESIILKKHNEFKTLEKTITEYINIFDKTFNLNIIVTNLSKVITTTKANKILENKELTKEYINILNERKIINKEDNKNKWIKNFSINGYTYICPIINNIELLGSIILFSSKPIINREKEIINLLVNLLKNQCNIV